MQWDKEQAILHAAGFQLEIAGNAFGGTLFKSIRDDGGETAGKKRVSQPAARPPAAAYIRVLYILYVYI